MPVGRMPAASGALSLRSGKGYVRLTKKQLNALTKDKIGYGTMMKVQGTYDGVQKIDGKSYPLVIGNDECKLVW